MYSTYFNAISVLDIEAENQDLRQTCWKEIITFFFQILELSENVILLSSL